LGKNQ